MLDSRDMKKIFAHKSSIIHDSSQIGLGTKVWHFCHIMENSIIGNDCNLGQNTVISPKVIIGNNVKIQNNVSVYTGVEIEDNVFIGPSVVFTNIKNPRSEVNRRNLYVKTLVKEGSSLGANSTIVCGITIGRYSMIGAGSVVTKNINDYALIVGNPGYQIGWVSEYGHRLVFINKEAKCKESNDRYILDGETVTKI